MLKDGKNGEVVQRSQITKRSSSLLNQGRRLIVNGDDFGRNEDLVRGVIQVYQKGILTSTTIVANSPFFDFAVSQAKSNPGLGIGLHLVIDEYSPVSAADHIPSLVKKDGKFHSRGKNFLRIMIGVAKRQEVFLEWSAQIQKALDAGLKLSHLDGHGHCHVCPNLGNIVVELARRYGIPAVRLPAAPLLYVGRNFSVSRFIENALLWLATNSARVAWDPSVLTTDACFGFMEGGNLDLKALNFIADRLPSLNCELICHPSLSDDDSPFNLAYSWHQDMSTLGHYSKEEFQRKFNVRLINYFDLSSERIVTN